MRKFVYVVVGVVAIVMLAALALPYLVDVNRYKPQIEALAREKTGVELRIPGKVTLSVFPAIALDVGAVEVKNPPGFGTEPLATLESASVRVALRPLLEHRVEVRNVVVTGLSVNLVRGKDGKTNWESIGAPAGAGAPTPSGSPPEQKGAFLPFMIAGVEIEKARLALRDEAAESSLAIVNLAAKVSEFAPGRDMDVSLAFDVSGKNPDFAGAAALSGKVTVSEDVSRVSVANLKVSYTPKGGETPEALGKAQIDIARAERTPDTLTLSGLRGDVLGVKFAVDVTGERMEKAPLLKGAVKVEPFSPRAIMEKLGQKPPADPAVLGKAALDMTFEAAGNGAAVRKITAVLDDTTLTGTVVVSTEPALAVTFNLALDTLDLDRYLPPKEKAAKAPEGAAAGTGEKAPEAAVVMPPLQLVPEGNGTFRVGALKAGGVRLEKLDASVKSKEGTVVLDPVKVSLYGGNLTASVTGACCTEPQYSLKAEMAGVNLGRLLLDATGKEAVAGTLGVTVNLSTSGETPEEMKKALDGSVAFTLKDGAVIGVPSGILPGELRTLLVGEGAGGRTDAVPLSHASASAIVKQGVARNDDFNAQGPRFSAKGAGTANLADNSVNYLATLNILGKIPVPVKIVGALDKPSISADLKGISLRNLPIPQMPGTGGAPVEKGLEGLKKRLF